MRALRLPLTALMLLTVQIILHTAAMAPTALIMPIQLMVTMLTMLPSALMAPMAHQTLQVITRGRARPTAPLAVPMGMVPGTVPVPGSPTLRARALVRDSSPGTRHTAMAGPGQLLPGQIQARLPYPGMQHHQLKQAQLQERLTAAALQPPAIRAVMLLPAGLLRLTVC